MDALYKRILIAIDSSVYSLKAARAGFLLAHQVKGNIGLLYVLDKGKEVVNADLGITQKESEILLLKKAEETINQYIQMFNGIQHIERFMPEGIPEQEIINVAKEWRADIIVMGTHGRSMISQMLSGSVAEYVIRHATMPVLVIPPRMA